MPKNYNEKAVQSDLRLGDFAMTLEEIGQAMGLNRQTVWTIYTRALRKLRKKHGAMMHIRAMANELDAHRSAPMTSADNE